MNALLQKSVNGNEKLGERIISYADADCTSDGDNYFVSNVKRK